MSDQQYDEVRPAKQDIFAKDYPWQGLEAPRLVTFKTNVHNDLQYVVAIGQNVDDCYKFVQQHYPQMTREQQLYELSHVDLWGDNGIVCINYVAQDAYGWTVAMGMASLADAGYDVIALVDDYFMP